MGYMAPVPPERMSREGRARTGTADAARLHSEVLISDFGPIKKAAISLRPLTIFIGTNNTGKSYAAMLVHSLISTRRRLDQPGNLAARPAQKSKNLERVAAGAEQAARALKPGEECDCPSEVTSKILRSSTGRCRILLENEIMRNFGSEVRDLSRSGGGNFSLTLKDGNGAAITYSNNRVALRFTPRLSIVLKKSKGEHARRFKFDQKSNTLRCTVASGITELSEGEDRGPFTHADLEKEVVRQAFSALPTDSDYFPAARSGILQAHRLIASNMVKSASYAGIKGASIPRLSGVVSDFASALIDMYEEVGAHRGTGSEIETDVLGGRLRLRSAYPYAIPEVVYDHGPSSIPLHRASSAISELALLTLHLKHRAADHGVLIVEEPEAHLHPSNQAVLAGHIVKLVRDGASVIITTHSAPLFESLSQYLQAGPLRPRDRKRALGREDLYLREDEIAPHLFRADGGGGSVVERIGASAREGIEQEEFVKEDRLLGENNVRICEYSGRPAGGQAGRPRA